MATVRPSTSFFDRWSATYDRRALQASTYRPIHDALLARIDDLRPTTVLDLGCGTGQLTRRLVDRFPEAEVVAVDLSPGMLTEAAERLRETPGGRCALVRADAQALPFAPDSVDLVTCTESFHWYRDPDLALAGLADIIRPGGRMVIASIATVTGRADDAIRRITGAQGRPIRALPPHRLRRLVQRAGFGVIHQRRIPRLGPIPWPVLTDARRI